MGEITTYKEAAGMIGKGTLAIITLLLRTLIRQTKALVIHHPVYLMLFFCIIVTQIVIIGKERARRDADSATIYHLQHELDSINNKQISYMRYK